MKTTMGLAGVVVGCALCYQQIPWLGFPILFGAWVDFVIPSN